MRLRPLLVMLLLCVVVIPHATDQAAAQSGPVTCQAMIDRALEQIGNACSNLPRNTACYGYNRVESVFNVPVEEGFFTQPAQTAPVIEVESLRTSPLQLAIDEWGIAVLQLQADVPNTLPGQGVTFVLLGDTGVESQVLPEAAFTPADPLVITLNAAVDARALASATAEIVATLGEGTSWDADAINLDGRWLRIVVDRRTAWIARDAVAADDALAAQIDALPTLTATTFGPMQAFYLAPVALGEPECQEAPDAVAIETPAELVVDFNVNGIDIQVGSLITLQMAAEDRLILSVHEGHVEASTGQVLDAGQSVEARLDREGRIVGFEPVRPRTEAEVQLGALAQAVMDRLRPEAQVDFCDLDQVEHVIQRGETLFGIARQYEASMPAIVARNAIADLNVITVGRTLIIPAPCSGFIAAAQPRPTPAATAEPVDCSPFVITGVTVQSQAAVITWSPLPEAIFYELVTFANGQVIDVRQLAATATSVGVEFGQVSYDQVDFQLIAYTAPGFAPCARRF